MISKTSLPKDRTVIVPARVYYGLIERFTTPTDRLVNVDRGEPLPDGRIRFELQDEALEALEPYLLEGESFADAIERLFETGGRVS